MTPRDSLALDRSPARVNLWPKQTLSSERPDIVERSTDYITRALCGTCAVALRDLDSSRHSRVISMFQQHFVQNGIVATDTARALPRAFEKRLRSDYDDFVEATASEVERLRTEVVSFVIACEQAVQRLVQA